MTAALTIPKNGLPSLDKAFAMLAKATTVKEVRNVRIIAAAVAAHERGKDVANYAGEIMLRADARTGELTIAIPQADPSRNAAKKKGVAQSNSVPKKKVLEEDGLTRARAAECEKIHAFDGNGDLDKYVNACRASKQMPTIKGALALFRLPAKERRKALAKIEEGLDVAGAIREAKRTTMRAQLDDVDAMEAKASAGLFDVAVIDPPWPMEKIERDERPNQVGFDYPTMSEEQLAELDLPLAENAHVWLWTTQKFLPMAFRLLDAWGIDYVCTFVWHKPGGMQPIGLPQYNCEFAIYARKGTPAFVDTKNFATCFDASRGKHSEKPEEFYDMIRRVTAGAKIDMFNRRKIEGFKGWGKEAA